MGGMKNSKKMALLLIPLLVVLCLYLSGYLVQLLQNYNDWRTEYGFASGVSPKLPEADFLVCVTSVFDSQYGIMGIVICLMMMVGIGIFIAYVGRGEKGVTDKKRNIVYSDSGNYGTAGFMSEEEMLNVLEIDNPKNTSGIILGKLNNKAVCLPKDTRMNKNIAVYGASGTMKSRAFVRNRIFQAVKRGESIFVTDPKSELYEDMAIYLKNNGYKVKVFNLINMENSDSWNCLNEIEGSELMAQVFTDVVIKNTSAGQSDHFWDNAELNLLKALVLYVSSTYKKKSIGAVYELLTTKTEKQLNAIFDGLGHNHPAFASYNIFKQASDTVRAGVIIGLGSRLQVFQNELVKSITSYDEIDLELPAREKCAYFCITSDQDSTFDFLSSLFFSFAFIKLVRYADTFGQGGRCDCEVSFILDEFPNIGSIVDFQKKISTVRSRGINISVIFQNLAQLQNRYPNNVWQEILGNCDSQVFLGCTDELTAQFISNRAGEITIGVTSTQKVLSTWQLSKYTPQYRETTSVGRRKLLTMDEILRMPLEKELLILRGQKVLELEKFDYTLHPESKKIIKSKAAEYVPEWKQSEKSSSEENKVEIRKKVIVSKMP